MIHKILSTFGLGILGIDPITAVYLLSMGLRNEKKTKVTLFFLSFAGFSIFVGVGLAMILGVAAIDFIKSVTPSEDSPLWAVLEFAISIFILIWISKKLFIDKKQTENQTKETVSGNVLKHIITGFVFAISSFTDPTFYAVVLISGETDNIFISILLLTIWFLVSQCLAVIVYIANQCNLLNKLVHWVNKFKNRNLKGVKNVFYIILIVIAILLIVDTGFYLFYGKVQFTRDYTG